MINEILKEIKNYFQNEIEKNKTSPYDAFTLHFGICLKMRNKFLWKNPKRTALLMQHFNVTNVDDLSSKIWQNISEE